VLNERTSTAASATVEALVVVLRGGISTLARQWVKDRLALLNEMQVGEVTERVQRFKQVAPAWTAEEAETFIKIWGEHHAHR